MWEHRQETLEGFTKRYAVKALVYYEHFEDIYVAINREKRVKRWRREWKLELIEKTNPTWKNLYDDATGNVAELPGGAFPGTPTCHPGS